MLALQVTGSQPPTFTIYRPATGRGRQIMSLQARPWPAFACAGGNLHTHPGTTPAPCKHTPGGHTHLHAYVHHPPHRPPSIPPLRRSSRHATSRWSRPPAGRCGTRRMRRRARRPRRARRRVCCARSGCTSSGVLSCTAGASCRCAGGRAGGGLVRAGQGLERSGHNVAYMGAAQEGLAAGKGTKPACQGWSGCAPAAITPSRPGAPRGACPHLILTSTFARPLPACLPACSKPWCAMSSRQSGACGFCASPPPENTRCAWWAC